MKLFLIRHGEANSEEIEVNLTPKGIMQSKAIAKELTKYSFSKIYSSDLMRAKTTAKEYINLTNHKVTETKDLREIYRVLVGGPIKENTSESREKKDAIRADRFFKKICNSKEDVLVFCHGNIIRYFINKILKSKENLWENVIIDNCSMSILELSPTIKKIKCINLTTHLI